MKSYRRPRFLSESCPDCQAPAGKRCLDLKRRPKKPCNILCGPISLSPRLRQLTLDDVATETVQADAGRPADNVQGGDHAAP